MIRAFAWRPKNLGALETSPAWDESVAADPLKQAPQHGLACRFDRRLLSGTNIRTEIRRKMDPSLPWPCKITQSHRK